MQQCSFTTIAAVGMPPLRPALVAPHPQMSQPPHSPHQPRVRAGVGGWAESGVNPADYSRMLMRVACAYIEGADVRAVSTSVDGWQSSPCASLNRCDRHVSVVLCLASFVALASSCSFVRVFSLDEELKTQAIVCCIAPDVHVAEHLCCIYPLFLLFQPNSFDSISVSSLDSGSSSDGSGSGRDPAAAVAVVDPRKALDTAHKLTKLPGSATACVVQLCPDQKSLIAANLVRQ